VSPSSEALQSDVVPWPDGVAMGRTAAEDVPALITLTERAESLGRGRIARPGHPGRALSLPRQATTTQKSKASRKALVTAYMASLR